MLPPSARGRTLCGFGIVLLLAPVRLPPPPALQHGALGRWHPGVAPSGDAAASGCGDVAGLRALLVLFVPLFIHACLHATLSALAALLSPHPPVTWGAWICVPATAPYREQQQQQRTNRLNSFLARHMFVLLVLQRLSGNPTASLPQFLPVGRCRRLLNA